MNRQTSNSILSRLRELADHFSNIVSRLTKRGAKKTLSMAEDLAKAAERVRASFEEAMQNASWYRSWNEAAGDGTRYAIEEDVNGNPYVYVQTSLQFSTKKGDLNENMRRLSAVLKEQFPDGILVRGEDMVAEPIAGRDVLKNKQTANEIAQGKSSRHLLRDKNYTVYTDKLGMAATALDDVIQATNRFAAESPDHSRNDDVVRFYRGSFNALINDRGYTASALIAEHSDGRLTMYDIVDMVPATIKKQTDSGGSDAPTGTSGGPNGRRAKLSLSKTSISESGDSVNRRMSISDDDYLQAVNSGDTDTAQQMVNEAAEAAMPNSQVRDGNGNLIQLYHGTEDMFTVFDPTLKGGTNGTAEGFGIYLTPNQEVSRQYGGRQISLFANITHPARSYEKTISRNRLIDLIKSTCEAEAAQFVAEESYDNGEWRNHLL